MGKRRGGKEVRVVGAATTAIAVVLTLVELPPLSTTTLCILLLTTIGSVGSASPIAELAVLVSYTASPIAKLAVLVSYTAIYYSL